MRERREREEMQLELISLSPFDLISFLFLHFFISVFQHSGSTTLNIVRGKEEGVAQ